jgi:hypothetical protein
MSVTKKEVDEAVKAAWEMIRMLCSPRIVEGHRDWVMSIPARPDYDPDLVIGQALRFQATRIGDLEEQRKISLALESLYREHAEWSRATFGSDAERGPVGPLKHLLKEVNEALEHPHDPLEYVDCLFLVFDASRRAGFSLEEMVSFGFTKLTHMRARTFPEPVGDEPIEHVREAAVTE